MTENTLPVPNATGLTFVSSAVNVKLTDAATVQDVREAFQELTQQIQMRDTRLIENGELEHNDAPPIRIRRFSEDLYIISGYRLPDTNASPVTARLAQYQSNPLAEAHLPGTYQPFVFQHGNRKEVGNNGLTMESLISICIDRLSSFQRSDYWCEENDCAIGHLEQALAALNRRTARRGAEGRLDTQIPEVTHANLTVRPISKAALASHGNNEPFGVTVAGPHCYRIKPDRVWASTDVFNEALTDDDLEHITADQYTPGDYLVEHAVSSLALGEPFVVYLVQKVGLPPPSDRISEVMPGEPSPS